MSTSTSTSTSTSATLDLRSAAPRPARRTGRSIGAVLAGFATIVVLSTVTDAVMHATGVFPPLGQPMGHGLFALATAYRILYGIAGCYLTARLAPARPLRHALVLGAIGTVLSIGGAVAMWDAGPAWYSLAIVAISLPCALIGARLHRAA